jgi:choline kinase
MIGLVLAAGPSRRLQPLTHDLPKTLLPVNGEQTVLDLALDNLRSASVEEVVVVTGFAAHRVEEQVPRLQEKHGLRIRLLFNDRAEEWNNAYSLWLARGEFRHGAVLVNGDTVHPASVENALVGARRSGVLLAVDTEKQLHEEEMKILTAADGSLRRISKAIDPATAAGEYIGVALIDGAAAAPLAEALEATWRRDPSLYYEDGFQELVDRGGRIDVVPVGSVEWVEIDVEKDLERARAIACRY